MVPKASPSGITGSPALRRMSLVSAGVAAVA